MQQDYARTWKSSRQPRKQRKYGHNAPLHVKGHFLHANLSKELRKKHGMRSIRVKTGDKVRVMRGQFKKTESKVERVDVKKTAIYIAKVDVQKKDGSKAKIPLHPSNVQITELAMDKSRQAKLEKK